MATMTDSKPLCRLCGSKYHYQTFCNLKPHRSIKKRSSKQIKHDSWIKQSARPSLVSEYGNICQLCKRPAYDNEDLDVDHILTKGSRPDLKEDISNLRLLCRSCHRLHTDGII